MRQSNIELLRIIAMFLVLILHANTAIGLPSIEETIIRPIDSFFRYLIQSLSIGCVDIFVLISGWFGIKPKSKSFVSFIFHCLYFLLGIYLVCCFMGVDKFNMNNLLHCFLFVPDADYWFIKCYILLYILTPILNVFIENTDGKTYKNILVFYFIFIFLYGWCYIAVNSIYGGYSTIFMIGLYLLGRYCNIYRPKWTRFSVRKDIIIILVSSLAMVVLAYIPLFYGINKVGKFVGSYLCPLTIFNSVYMVILFSKLNINSRFINYLASSAFSVYLFHTHISLFDLFKSFINNTYNKENGIYAIAYIFLFICSVYIFAILFDQPRKLLWKLITKSKLL